MSKHQFTDADTYAVWKHHGAAWYICEEPLRIQEATVEKAGRQVRVCRVRDCCNPVGVGGNNERRYPG